MKKLTTILGITLLSGLLIVPVISWARGWGWGGGHMMGYWGRGPGDYDRDDRGYASTLTREQQDRLTDLDRKFYDETRELRDKLWSKSAELNAALAEASPDTAKVTGLQKEVSDLRAKLDEKMVTYEIEARKIAPDNRFSGGYGYGRHMMGGYGRGGYGMGPGMMGYGPGACWNN
ncbi:MAG: periplasmic heavy metal sensor [Thermodesulfobacteriota bacterium]